MENFFRISKYNPEYRFNGVYSKEEWTDYSDIGSFFNGSKFTYKQYIDVERSYINTIIEIAKLIGVSSFVIDSIEIYEENNNYQHGQRLNISEVKKIAKNCLRNKCWCLLVSDKYSVSFGYDYYLHILVDLGLSDIKNICSKNGLYVEETPNDAIFENI